MGKQVMCTEVSSLLALLFSTARLYKPKTFGLVIYVAQLAEALPGVHKPWV